MRDQLSFVDSSVVFPKVSFDMCTELDPKTVAGAVHLPMASALDFLGLMRTPVAFSYSCMALRVLLKSVGDVANTVISCAYATTVERRARYPIIIPDRLSSSMRRRGWRQCVQQHTQRAALPDGAPDWDRLCHGSVYLYGRCCVLV